MLILHYFPLLLILSFGMAASVKTDKLTLSGALTGGITAIMIFTGAGYTGILMLTTFFVLGTLATTWKKELKEVVKLKEDRSVKRNAGQVFANGGIAGIAGLMVCLFPLQANLFRLMMAAALSSAMADTLSSELGMVYGRRFYNISSLKKDERGLDGVVSLEGFFIGIMGSVLVAVIYSVGFGWQITFLFIIAAGTIGNLADSLLGAALERRHYLSNDMVNLLNTLIAAIAAWLCVL